MLGSSFSRNCKELHDAGYNTTGLYIINPTDTVSGEFIVFCDMTLEGGGWTVIQRRISDDYSFNKNWTDYKAGFGEINSGSYWLGLQKIHDISNSGATYNLYIGMESFHPNLKYAAAAYSNFSVGDDVSKYALSIGGFYKPHSDPDCDGGDSLTIDHHGQKFSTPDQDNDDDSTKHCANVFCSGWWYHSCHDSHLNGKWYEYGELDDFNVPDGIIWEEYRGDKESLKTVVMAVRPV